MANRRMNQFRYSLENMPTDLFLNLSFGTVGTAPTLTSNENKGISSIVYAGASGAYTITLQDNYNRIMAADCTFIASSGIPTSPIMKVTADNSAATPPTVGVVFYTAAGTATCPASGQVGLMHLVLKNSSV